ncbi:asparagine synthase (glutamine-hydrolyzing) [Streptosporangium sp. NPDC002607]
MCGLAGFTSTNGSALSADSDHILRSMVKAIAHRGPDDEQLVLRDTVALGFTRLSLNDPPGGRQPFVSEDGQVMLVANGEVYNHRELAARLPAGTRFRGKSDCEVLLHLYLLEGRGFLDRVRGMFAVAIFDLRRGRLLLARDRFGIKPLFLTRNDRSIAFASEIKSLLRHPECPRAIDWESSLADQALCAAPVLEQGEPTTWFRGIEHVPAATIYEVDLRNGETSTHRYWRMPEVRGDSAAYDREYVETYRDLLASSVNECVTADAEIGLFLSGGIDSASVAALAAHTGLHTFTTLTGSTVANGDSHSAHRVARLFDLPNHQVLLPSDQAPEAEEWRQLLWLLETPQCGPEQFYKYRLHRYAKSVRPGLKGIMLGAGADEFNGGYSVELAGGGDWSDFLANVRDMGLKSALGRRPALASWWEDQTLPLIREEALHALTGTSLDDPYRAFLRWKARDTEQYNCWHEDRTASGNAIESRVPFLDHRIVELLGSIPVSRREDLLWDKRILRLAMRDLLPPDIVNRPKVAFYEGDGVHRTQRTFVTMLARDGNALLEEALACDGAREHVNVPNARAWLRRLEANPQSGRVELLLRLVNLGLLEQMVRQPAPPPTPYAIGEVPTVVKINDWEEARMEIESRSVGRRPLDRSLVLKLGENVMILDSTGDKWTSYIAFDGQLEYVVDGYAEPCWLQFLREVDGKRSIEKIVSSIRGGMDEVEKLIWEALDCGILASVEHLNSATADQV